MLEIYVLRKLHTPKRGELFEIRLTPITPTHPAGNDKQSSRIGTALPARRMEYLTEAMTGKGNAEQREDSLVFEERFGQRMALAFNASKYLKGDESFKEFCLALADLPEEVILYWFTLANYGGRQVQACKALTVLLAPAPARRRKAVAT